jgi:hypothetical protein
VIPILILGAAGLGLYYLATYRSSPSAASRTSDAIIGADVVECSREFTSRGYGDLLRRAMHEAPSHALAEELDAAIHVMRGPLGCEPLAKALESAQTYVMNAMVTPTQHLLWQIKEARSRGADPRYVRSLVHQYDALIAESRQRRIQASVRRAHARRFPGIS